MVRWVPVALQLAAAQGSSAKPVPVCLLLLLPSPAAHLHPAWDRGSSSLSTGRAVGGWLWCYGAALTLQQSCSFPWRPQKMEAALPSPGSLEVLVLPSYRDHLCAVCIFCLEPQTKDYDGRSPMNHLWNKAYCALTCPCEVPINRLVTASLPTAAADVVQIHMMALSSGAKCTAVCLLIPAHYKKDLPEGSLPFSLILVSCKNNFSGKHFLHENFSSPPSPGCWIGLIVLVTAPNQCLLLTLFSSLVSGPGGSNRHPQTSASHPNAFLRVYSCVRDTQFWFAGLSGWIMSPSPAHPFQCLFFLRSAYCHMFSRYRTFILCLLDPNTSENQFLFPKILSISLVSGAGCCNVNKIRIKSTLEI